MINFTAEQQTYLKTQDQFRNITNFEYTQKGANFLFTNGTVEETDDVEISDAQLKEMLAKMAAPGTEGTPQVQNAPQAGNVAQLEEELKAKKAKKEENEKRIADLETQIKDLQTKIQDQIEEAMKDADKIADEQKQAMAKSSEAILESYTKGDINYEEMRSQMAAGFADISSEFGAQFAEKVNTMMNASADMAVLRSSIDEMSGLIEANKTLDTEIAKCEQDIKAAQTPPPAPKSCDPIGFEKDGVRYDFFIDKDNDNKLSNEKEFLGSGSQWAEMEALDGGVDGAKDGIVSAEELEKAGVKVAVTENGKTTMKSVTELGIGNIDLNSYKKDGSVDEKGNTLLGTFGLTMGNEKIDNAYNTLDTLEWLDSTYEFSDKANGIGRFGAVAAQKAPEATIEERLAQYEAEYNELNTKLNEGFAKLGFEGTIMETLKSAAKIKAEQDGRIAKQGVEAEKTEATRKEDAIKGLKDAGIEYDENMTAAELETLLKKGQQQPVVAQEDNQEQAA